LQHRLRTEGVSGAGRDSILRPEIQVIKNYDRLPPVICYASQLNQVLMNLLNNAIDALETQPSPRVITISTQISSELENSLKAQIPQSVIIRIADNGPGMSEAVKEKIFDPFFTTKPVGSGTGLGLSISYQIVVEKHKGKLSCISAPGQGTELLVEIPVVPLND
jgi:signal transduction histidine kinase